MKRSGSTPNSILQTKTDEAMASFFQKAVPKKEDAAFWRETLAAIPRHCKDEKFSRPSGDYSMQPIGSN